jgi:hypothetical protein
MKYEQPFGLSDPNASYTNGNPSTGTMGSIPPAASIENPQREIVNTIADAGIPPTDADLHQLAKAIQSCQLNFKHDSGIANSYSANLIPSPGSYFEGLTVVLKINVTNTGASALNLNSLGYVPVVRSDGVTALAAGDLTAGSYVCFLFDGTSFRTVWAQTSAGASGQPTYLNAPLTVYVNGTTGNDTYDGLTATFSTGIHGPFKTIQRACNLIPLYNMNGYTFTINVADGSYANFSMGTQNGSGTIEVWGNRSNPAACTVFGSNVTAIQIATGNRVNLGGFKISNSGAITPAEAMAGVATAYGGTFVELDNMEFGPCTGPSLYANWGSVIGNYNPHCTWRVSGGSQTFLNIISSSQFIANAFAGPDVTIVAAVTFGYFVHAAYNSTASLIFGALIGGGNVSGTRYFAEANSTINSYGGGPNYYPGTIAGATAS